MRHLMIATLFAVTAAGCIAGEPGPFDPEDGADDTIVSGADGKDDSATCKTKSVAAYALGGTLILPSGPTSGYVLIQDERIVSIWPSKELLPPGTRVVETGGVIAPGLVDLHNHVNYDFIPLWNAGRRWQNRYQWARAAAYGPAVKTPYNAVKNSKDMCESGKYGELRALIGGTTTVQGMSSQLSCTNGWVRNVEFTNFCADHVRQNVLPISTITPGDAAKLNAQYTSGQTRAFFVHLAEGIDDSSRAEFDQLRTLGLVKPQTVAIHATALNPAQLTEMGQAGMKIVWSPLSNLLLYGKTTDIPTALANHIPVALAPDWRPSGSSNLLGELKVADRVNREKFGGVISDAQLVAMATSVPASIAGLGDKIGTIAPGMYADLLVVRAQPGATAYRSVIDASPADVLLTTISGQALFGDPTIVGGVAQPLSYTQVDACGTPRQLAVVDATLTSGAETLDQITSTFTGDGVGTVEPLFNCNAQPDIDLAFR